MKRKSGFTLIELVVVIVILGILAVTAAPRFLNIQDDAREARLEGMKGAIASGLGIGYGKMAVAGLEDGYVSNFEPNTPNFNLPFDGCDIGGTKRCAFRYGYPDTDETGLTLIVPELDHQYGDTDWQIKRTADKKFMSVTVRSDSNSNESHCNILYAAPQNENETYTLKINHCS